MSAFPDFDTLADSAHITAREVARFLGISVPTVWRWTQEGKLPEPTRFSSRCTRWPVGKIRQTLASYQ